MKKPAYILFISLLATFLFSCTRGSSRFSDLLGRWNITDYRRISIYYDGTTDTTLYEQNNGYFEFTQFLDSDFIFDLNYSINTNGGVSQGTAGGQITDDGYRLVLYGGQCVGCDNAYTIEQWGGGTMRLTQYAPIAADSTTYKLQMDFKKQ